MADQARHWVSRYWEKPFSLTAPPDWDPEAQELSALGGRVGMPEEESVDAQEPEGRTQDFAGTSQRRVEGPGGDVMGGHQVIPGAQVAHPEVLCGVVRDQGPEEFGGGLGGVEAGRVLGGLADGTEFDEVDAIIGRAFEGGAGAQGRKPARLGRPPSSSYPLAVIVDGQTWVQAREAARRLKLSRTRIVQLLGDGRLAGRLIHGTSYVRVADVRWYQQLQAQLALVRAAMCAPRRRRPPPP